MNSATFRAIAAICAIALTVMLGVYIITSTPLCEVFSTVNGQFVLPIGGRQFSPLTATEFSPTAAR